ncbi:type II secretion system protein [Vibrio sp. TRT 29B02]|uniref:type II secretion system protein n=1 Tax=Vibrio sp. TRT 29B02 TaxID=3418508 RepID=UPI003CEF3A77
MLSWQSKQVEDIKNTAYETQAKRLGEIANAVVRYISSAGDPATGLLAPHEQFSTAGQPFNNGAVHVGLSWLKQTTCSGGLAPSNYLPCDYVERPIVGDDQVYRFTVNNDGTNLVVSFQYLDRSNTARGVVIRGNVEPLVAATLSTKAEGAVSFSSAGATNTFFRVDPVSAIISMEIGLNIANTPYQRTDGRSPITGDEHLTNGASIIFDSAGDVRGANIVSAERFSAYDRASNTVSTTRFLEPDGTSEIESLNAAEEITTKSLRSDNSYLESIQTDYFEQLDANIQNIIAGELRVGNATNHTTLSEGHIFTTGNIYDANDPNYLIDIDGTSRFQDIALGALNEARLSERLPNFVQKGAVVTTANTSVPMPTCGATGAARMILIPIKWTTYFLDEGNITINNNINEFYADESGSNWITRMKTYSAQTRAYIDDVNAVGLANIYCYYP